MRRFRYQFAVSALSVTVALILCLPRWVLGQTDVNPPIFSHEGGFYSSSFSLTLEAGAPGGTGALSGTVLYTLDGSQPHPDTQRAFYYQIQQGYRRHPLSPRGSFVTDSLKTFIYEAPIPITDATHFPNRFARWSTTWDEAPIYAPASPNPRAIVVRALTVTATGGMSEVVTHTYFIQNAGRFNHTLPVVSVGSDGNRFFDYENGIYVPGIDFEQWRDSNPSESAHAFSAANYTRRGSETEFAGFFTFFESGEPVVNQPVGLRIHGGATRSFPLKSLRLYARNSYGSNTLRHRFFEATEDEMFRRIVLRNNGDDFLRGLIRDRVHHRLAHRLGLDVQHDRAVVVYLNGEYWGLMAIRERIDYHYLNRRYALNDTPVDLLAQDMDVEEGSAEHYMQMMQFVIHHDMADSNNYKQLDSMMDIDQYIRYIVAQMYIANTDWPHNNIRYWRVRAPGYNAEALPGRDGRWRWIFFDTDIGSLGNRYEIDMMTHSTRTDPSVDWSTLLIRKLLENEAFRIALLHRFAEVMHTTFAWQAVIGEINHAREEVDSEVPAHIIRWKRPVSYAAWNASVDEIAHFFRERPRYMQEHLLAFFSLEGMAEVRLEAEDWKGGVVQLHQTRIAASDAQSDTGFWSGSFFAGVPIQVTALPDSGYRFAGWSGSIITTDTSFVLVPGVEKITLIPEFQPLSSSVNAIPSVLNAANVILESNHPNPFNPLTDIPFEVRQQPVPIRLSVHDLTGREVAVLMQETVGPGRYTVQFDGQSLASGVYIVVLDAGFTRQTRMMTLLK